MSLRLIEIFPLIFLRLFNKCNIMTFSEEFVNRKDADYKIYVARTVVLLKSKNLPRSENNFVRSK